MNYDEFQKRVVAEAQKLGIHQYELYYAEEENSSAEAMKGELSSFSSDKQAGACFRCIAGGKMGYCATELFTEEQAAEIVRKAIENASTVENEDEVFLYSGGGTYRPAAQNELPEADLAGIVLSMQEATHKADQRVQDGSLSEAFSMHGSVRIVNSEGLDLSNQYSYQGAGMMAVVKGEDSLYNAAQIEIRPLRDLDPKKVAEKAVQKTLERIGAQLVDTGQYPAVFDAEAMGEILTAYSSIFSADMAQKGLSLLAGKEGTAIAAECVTVIDDPFDPESPIQTSFDAEGVPSCTKTVIDKGILKTLLHNLKTAAKAGTVSTGNASKAGYASPVEVSPYSFYLAKGNRSLEELFQYAGNGVYITDVKGLHAGTNAVTGDFSIECAGFLIENGKKSRAITSFTVSGNFFDFLKNIQEVADDLYFQMPCGFSRIGSPSVLVGGLSVAGK